MGNKGSIAKQINMPGFKEAITPTVAQGSMSVGKYKKRRNGNDQRDAVIKPRMLIGMLQPHNDIQQVAVKLQQAQVQHVMTNAKTVTMFQRGQKCTSCRTSTTNGINNPQEIERLKQLIQGRR